MTQKQHKEFNSQHFYVMPYFQTYITKSICFLEVPRLGLHEKLKVNYETVEHLRSSSYEH